MKNAQPSEATKPSVRSNAKSIAPLTARQERLVHALLIAPLSREQVDRVSGASNGPQIVRELRSRGLTIPCRRREAIDRDGQPCLPGEYSFTEQDREFVRAWGLRHG